MKRLAFTLVATVSLVAAGLASHLGTDRVIPDAQTLLLGRFNPAHFSGLFDDDNDPERACKFFVPDIYSPWVRLQVEGTTTILEPSDLAFRVKSKAVSPGLYRQDLFMYDWTANSTVKLRSDSVQTTYVTVDGVGTGDLARFVDPATGKLRARIEFWQTGPSTAMLPCIDIDLANWFVTS